jgi:hypothetical protein
MRALDLGRLHSGGNYNGEPRARCYQSAVISSVLAEGPQSANIAEPSRRAV